MGRFLAIAAVLVGAYALWAGQNPHRAFKPQMPAALFAPSGNPAGSVAATAVKAAGGASN